jgi:hypothetical protein
VVVVEWLAHDVRMLAARQVDPLDRVELDEHIEGAEDRRAAEPEPARSACATRSAAVK